MSTTNSVTLSVSRRVRPVLASEDSPVFLVPVMEIAASLWMQEDRLISVFRTGEGIACGDHHHRLFCGSEPQFYLL
ncbi:MAG: hypothetical protein AB8B94_00895 [Hyphomicrobiales bacterium]